MSKAYTHQMLLDVLAKSRGNGSFNQLVAAENGEAVTHSFSFSTGMASAQWRHRYSCSFKSDVPPWVALAHPDACSELCQIAIAANRPLPKKQPKTSKSKSEDKGGFTPMTTVGPADTETKAFLERQFGSGSILFGQKRPSSSEQKSPQPTSEQEDPAVSQQTEIENRFDVEPTTEVLQGSMRPEFLKSLERAKLKSQKPTTEKQAKEVMNRLYVEPKKS